MPSDAELLHGQALTGESSPNRDVPRSTVEDGLSTPAPAPAPAPTQTTTTTTTTTTTPTTTTSPDNVIRRLPVEDVPASVANGDVPVAEPTPGQILRGHGPTGWAGAIWDIDNTTLTSDLRNLVLTYGELAQATYDNLGLDRCDDENGTNWGHSTKPPSEFLSYLTKDYPLAVGAAADARPGTCDMYKLPTATGTLSPFIYALAGKGSSDASATELRPHGCLQGLFWNCIVGKCFETITGVLVTFIDSNNGSRALSKPNPATGRGKEQRGAFMGYVAVSKPQDLQNPEVDVAVVWRGTIFREEWESNFAQDELAFWNPTESNDRKELQPCGIGVHDGFDDLYTRDIEQPPGTPGTPGMRRSPRTVVCEWLKLLMNENNVTTITITGHSLGGALATVCALRVGYLLKHDWKLWNKTGWKTTNPPKVTVISFAAPRVGNYKFIEKFRSLGIRAMRVVNKGDVVPLVPGLGVQLLSKLVPSRRANVDSDAGWARCCMSSYYCLTVSCWCCWRPKWAYFHLGQALEVDSSKSEEASDDVVANNLPVGKKHNLELYLYAVSRLPGPNGPHLTNRNPLLLNKSDDILANKDYPANWWRAKEVHGHQQEHRGPPPDWWRAKEGPDQKQHRGYQLTEAGRWEYQPMQERGNAATGASPPRPDQEPAMQR